MNATKNFVLVSRFSNKVCRMDITMNKLDTTYKIVRLYRDVDRESQVIHTGLTLEEAQSHCRDESTSTPEYFDGYMEE